MNAWIPTFKIVVRCIELGTVRTFNKKNGDQSKFFKAIIMDKLQTEMRVTAWGDEADRFYPLIKQNGCYLLSNGRIKQQDQAFADGISNMNCMELDHSTSIKSLADNGSIPFHSKLKFTPISDFAILQKNHCVNVVASILSVGEKRQLASTYKDKPRFILSLIHI